MNIISRLKVQTLSCCCSASCWELSPHIQSNSTAEEDRGTKTSQFNPLSLLGSQHGVKESYSKASQTGLWTPVRRWRRILSLCKHKSRVLWCKFQSLYFIQMFISAAVIKHTRDIHFSVLSSRKDCVAGLVTNARHKYSICTVTIKPMQNSQILFEQRPLCWIISCTFAYVSGQLNDVASQVLPSSVTIWL